MICRLLFFSIVLGITQPSLAQERVVPSPPTGDASSYILLDYHSGRIIAEKNPDQALEPASLTKMMTVYVAGEELEEGHVSMDDQVLVSEKAWRMPGSRMFIEVDTRVSVEELLNGIIVQSGNDASVALAEHISGTEEVFAQLMNQVAERIGLQDSHFENSTGMPEEGHITTARDMAILARALIRDYPELYSMHAIREYTYNDITQPNRNRLLWRDASVDGIKTGHTQAAGYCLATSAEREDMRLISVVMGAGSESSRTAFTQSLLEYGFRFYETTKLAEAGQALGNMRIWKGNSEQVDYGVTEDIHVTVPRGQADDIRRKLEFDEPLLAPIGHNQLIGSMALMLDDEILARQPLVALHSVEQAGLFGRLVDSVRLMLE